MSGVITRRVSTILVGALVLLTLLATTYALSTRGPSATAPASTVHEGNHDGSRPMTQ